MIKTVIYLKKKKNFFVKQKNFFVKQKNFFVKQNLIITKSVLEPFSRPGQEAHRLLYFIEICGYEIII
jgi:hypothetical protein